MTKRSFMIQAALGALTAVPIAGYAVAATTPKPPSFHVEITGNGKPMILIPAFAAQPAIHRSHRPRANGGFLVRLKGGLNEMSRRQAQKFKEVMSL
jgi:hypothetical protein